MNFNGGRGGIHSTIRIPPAGIHIDILFTSAIFPRIHNKMFIIIPLPYQLRAGTNGAAYLP